MHELLQQLTQCNIVLLERGKSAPDSLISGKRAAAAASVTVSSRNAMRIICTPCYHVGRFCYGVFY